MLPALALATVLYTVKPGDTLSGIAQHYNTTWEAIYTENHTKISNPNLVYAGERLHVRRGDHSTAVSAQAAAAVQSAPSAAAVTSTPVQSTSTSAQSTPVQSYRATTTPTSTSGQSYDSGSLSDIPGVPSSFASCVAYRESTDDTNPAANGNAYGIIPASGYDVGGDSIAQQKQVFKEIYDTSGPSAWASDGCA